MAQNELNKIREKLFGTQSSGLDRIREKLFNRTTESDRPQSQYEIDEDVLPFGALGVTKDGMPYYGEGAHGWIRKTYGDLFDPRKRLMDPTEEDYEKYQGYVEKLSEFVDTRLNYKEWGERVFGLSSKEAGNVLAALITPGAIHRENLRAQVEAGEITQAEMIVQDVGSNISNAVNLTKDTMQRGLWGALEILGLSDTGMRKLSAIRMGLDDLADKYGKPDEEINFFQQFNPQGEGFWAGAGRSVLGFADAISRLEWIGQMKDAATIAKAVSEGRLTVNEVLQKTYGSDNPYLRGSNAIYTLAADETVRREYVRRVELGEDPGFVAAELGRPGLELTGSILGDPLTYLGLGLYKPSLVGTPMKIFGKEVKIFGNVVRVPWEKIGRIPTFGELVGLGVDTRFAKYAEDHYFKYANDEAFRAVKNAYDAGDDAETLRLLDTAARKIISPGEVAAEQGKKIKKTGIGDFFSKNEEVRKAANKNQYSFTSYTAEGRVKLAARDVSLVVDMVFSGSKGDINVTLDTLRDMVAMHRGSPNEKLMAVKRLMLKGSYGADGKITGHGALFFSEAGLLAGDLLARLEPNKIDDLFVRFGDDPVAFQEGLFNLLDGAFREVFPTVDEMADAKKLVRAGNREPKILELARRYDELPPRVRNISRIHRQTSKVVGKSTGMQVNLYMKYSPGYVARNIFGQGLGIALDQGLGRAISTSIDAFWKPIVEWITGNKINPAQKHIISRVQQVKDLVGVAPYKMLEAMGMAEVKDAKAMLKVAQTGEAMTSADIVAHTIFDEIEKAMPAILSGDASVKTALVDTGVLNEKQANLFVKLLKDFNGNADKAIQALRRSISGGNVETWRHIPMPRGVEDIFRKTGRLGEVQALQESATTMDEFVEGVRKILQDIYDGVRKNAGNEPASISSNVPDEIRSVVDDIIDNFNAGELDDFEADLFTRKIQAWQNVHDQLDNVTTRLRDELVVMDAKKGTNSTRYKNAIQAAETKFKKTYRIVNDVRNMTVKIIKGLYDGTITPEQAFARLKHSDVYDIQKIFPDVDPSRLSSREAVRKIWDGYFEFSASHWRKANNDRYQELLGIFGRWAKANGTSLDDMAALHNMPNDPMYLLQRAYKEAEQIEEMGNPRLASELRNVEGATLDDMILTGEQVDASGKAFSKKRIFATVNAERKAQGLQPYATYADVPWKEAQKIMRSRMGRFATPAEVVKKVNKMLEQAETTAKKIKLTEDTALDELPAPVLERVKILARRMLDELSGGGVEKSSFGGRLGSTNIEWWKELSASGKKRDAIENALEKIAKGTDANTANVKKVKEMIFDRIRYGDPATGTPPDMYALQQLNADKKTMQAALEDFNEITKNDFSLQEAIDATTPSDELLARSDMPFYNEKGELIQPKRYARIQDIPEDVVKKAIEAEKLPPPPLNSEYITTARAYWENMDGFMQDAKAWVDDVTENWGKLDEAGDLPDELETAISGWKKVYDDRMQYVKDKALVVAGMKRDFLLHDYNKTYADVALAYLMPFSYWHTRTYARWAERLVDNPKWANMYMAYKRKMEKEHAGMPDWWRQNVGINLPGMENNPIFLNLEATINPLNGLTGVDFNDPYKRVDWLSRTVDDLGKMGPAFAAPLNWAMALYLYNKGEEEAAKRWMGRLFPQTMQVKGVLTKAGLDINAGPFIKHNELDPFINLTSDGLDPYELNRVNRHLAQIVENEPDPAKRQLLATQAIDAARTHSGPLWEQARRNAINERAGGQIASYLLGVGFKPRNQEDMKVDQFYGEYFKLLKLRDTMSAEDYRESWDRLRDKYPFADALIIGKKSDPERDSAFAYNVLGRIPPGQMGDLFGKVGLTNEDINRFYSSKGDFKDWTEGDQKRFMAAVVDLSAILQMPQLSTRQEWNRVKTDYNRMREDIQKEFGDDIWEKVEQYFALKNEARYKGNAYLHDHPEVSAALDAQTRLMVGNPLLYKYYGSLDTLQSYYNGEVRKELEAKYGQGIYEVYYAYLDAPTKEEKKAIMAKVPQLKQFMKDKSKMKDPVNRAIVEMASRLPDRPTVEYRQDLTSPTTAQQNLINTLNVPAVDPQMLWANTSPALAELIYSYWLAGDELPYAARSNLDYIAEQFGISGDEALQIMGISLQGQAAP